MKILICHYRRLHEQAIGNINNLIPDLSVSASNQHQLDIVQLLPNGRTEIKACRDRPQICGKEAACRRFPDNTSKCVCPHDLSPPTSDLRCPNRLTGKATRLSFHKKPYYKRVILNKNNLTQCVYFWRLKDSKRMT